MSESIEGRRTLRTRVDLRLAALLLLLPLTFLASRSCGDTRHQVTQSEAMGIARAEVTYRPDGTNIRFVRRGIPSRSYWAVSLWQLAADGSRTHVTVVVIDAETGNVTQLNRNTKP